MLRSSGPSGFFNAPVSKAWLFLTIGITLTAAVLGIKDSFTLSLVSHVLGRGQVWRLLTHHFLFSKPGEMLFGCVLLYYFRLFERQWGSRKFAAFSFVAFLLSTLVSAAFVVLFNWEMLPGPYGHIFACVVQFMRIVPVSYRCRVCGINLSDKAFVYLLCLQLAISGGRGSFLASLCGVISGLIYRSNLAGVRNFAFPEWLVRSCVRVFMPVLRSEDPSTRRRRPTVGNAEMGHMLGAGGVPRDDPTGRTQGYSDTLIPSDNPWALPQQPLVDAEPAPPPPPPSEEDVATLMGMGFDRDRVVSALAEAGNDVQRATNSLLDG